MLFVGVDNLKEFISYISKLCQWEEAVPIIGYATISLESPCGVKKKTNNLYYYCLKLVKEINLGIMSKEVDGK